MIYLFLFVLFSFFILISYKLFDGVMNDVAPTENFESNEDLFDMYNLTADDFQNKDQVIKNYLSKQKNSESIKDFSPPAKCLSKDRYEDFVNARYKRIAKLKDAKKLSEREASFIEDTLCDYDVSQAVKKKIIDKLKIKFPDDWYYFASITRLPTPTDHYWMLMGAPFPEETSDYKPFIFKSTTRSINRNLFDTANESIDLNQDYFALIKSGGANINLRNFKGLNILSKYIYKQKSIGYDLRQSDLENIANNIDFLVRNDVEVGSFEKGAMHDLVDYISSRLAQTSELDEFKERINNIISKKQRKDLSDELSISIKDSSEIKDFKEKKKRKI